ncbi:hypothetical protein TREES_T100013932 [Tupaia chinensis]|uniref:Uncharacterized protein n=1 Tax=Tupaia chinensis TaxID=246437 RepID=L9KVZ9_TUPCH|nr:hypothetical protein TREES_T100013932 [Tupaia chinensis]
MKGIPGPSSHSSFSCWQGAFGQSSPRLLQQAAGRATFCVTTPASDGEPTPGGPGPGLRVLLTCWSSDLEGVLLCSEGLVSSQGQLCPVLISLCPPRAPTDQASVPSVGSCTSSEGSKRLAGTTIVEDEVSV